MRIATWNVNSIRARLPRVEAWCDEHRPDVLCLQETKVRDEQFPSEPFVRRGYRIAIHGQPTYNGVAILARAPLEQVARGMPGDPAEGEARLVAATVAGVRIHSVYVPNGTALGSERFAFKLAWLARLRDFLAATCRPGEPVVVCGDFNVAPEDRDMHDPQVWRGQLLCTPEEQGALRDLQAWGLVDAFRLREPGAGHHTWWDYRGGAFHRGLGLRIDLTLVSAPLAGRVRSAVIDREARKGPGPSDHAPVVIELDPADAASGA